MADTMPEILRGAVANGELWRTLAAAFPGYVSCIDRERRILFLSKTLSRDLAEVLGKPVEDFVSPAQRAAAIAKIEAAFASGREQSHEYDAVLADGGERHIVTRILPVETKGGATLAMMLTEDHSERQLLERQLAQSLEFRRRVVEHMPDFVCLVDRAHRMVWTNRLAPGLTEAKVLGVEVEKYMSTETGATAATVIDRTFETGNINQFEAEGYRDDQQSGWYQTRVAPVLTDGSIDHVLLITSDISDRKRAERALRETEEQLHRAQRLESIGQLAGGIAHDFNNLLQVLSGTLLFAREGLGRGEDVKEELEQALRATQQAAALTSHLLTIGRRKRLDAKPVDLGVLVGSTVRMLRRAIPENVALAYEEPPEPFFVALDAPQFEQVLINLCVNARDAMPGGGRLDVHLGPDGTDRVLLTVSDTGTGIAKTHLARIFEPFFSTKGAGSGLGLAVAAGIVAAHKGTITAESDGRSGTTFRVSLPRLPSLELGEESEERPVSEPTAGVVLVAEDQPEVRAQAVRVLERAGYRVLQAENGARAVELFREHKSEIDLVLLDAIMPVMDGWNAYLRMSALKPGLKVVFATGYAADVLPADFRSQQGRLLSKPFTPTALLREVAALLAQRAG